MQSTPRAERTHIAFFGRRNAGKSSLVNAVTGQDTAVVSAVAGTTTDPVYKSMELLPLGPVVLIDTPGFDDSGTLGTLRLRRTRQVLEKTDIAVLVLDAAVGETNTDRELLGLVRAREIPFLRVYTKTDKAPAPAGELAVSANTGVGISALKEALAALAANKAPEKKILQGLLKENDLVVLVTPIDAAAPKARLILPQQQVLREVLDNNAAAITAQPAQLQHTLAAFKTAPALVVTDSQVFGEVAKLVPAQVPLTSFSILMARYKGFLAAAVQGAAAIDRLQNGDTVLVCEGCTHHRQCDDIGTVKLPRWLQQHTGKVLQFLSCSGTDFPQDLSPYALVLHCGGCMLNERTVQFRKQEALRQQIPFTNYGIAIAHMQGILQRSIAVFAQTGLD